MPASRAAPASRRNSSAPTERRDEATRVDRRRSRGSSRRAPAATATGTDARRRGRGGRGRARGRRRTRSRRSAGAGRSREAPRRARSRGALEDHDRPRDAHRPRYGRRTRCCPASASGSAVESSSAHCAPKRRRGSMKIAVLVVRVEQQEERVVLDVLAVRPGGRDLAPVQEHPEHVLAALPVAPSHLQPVGAEPPDIGKAGALELLAARGSSRGGAPDARAAARSDAW